MEEEQGGFSRWADLALANAGNTVRELTVMVGPQKLIKLRDNSFCITNGDGKAIMFSEPIVNAEISDFGPGKLEAKIKTQLSKAEQAQVSKMVIEHLSDLEIAAKLGVSRQMITGFKRQTMPKFCLKSKQKPDKFSQEQENEIRTLIKKGNSSQEIAEKFGCDPRKIGNRRLVLKRELAQESKQPTNQDVATSSKRDVRGRLIWTKGLLKEVKKASGANLQAFADSHGISLSAARSGKYHPRYKA